MALKLKTLLSEIEMSGRKDNVTQGTLPVDTNEAVNPELDKTVKKFVDGLASKYAYKSSDAVMAIFEALKRLGLLDKNVNYKASGVAEALPTYTGSFAPTIYDLIGQPLEDLGVKIDEMIRANKDPKWISALKVIRTSLASLEKVVDAADRRLGVMPMAEGVESAFEDEFALDNSKGGTDNSFNKIHRQLLKLQTQMNMLFVDFKNGKIDQDTYVQKRKPLQDLRNKLEYQLL